MRGLLSQHEKGFELKMIQHHKESSRPNLTKDKCITVWNERERRTKKIITLNFVYSVYITRGQPNFVLCGVKSVFTEMLYGSDY